jgi:HAD superfamily hydrolase (TIGR01509 family)
MTILLDIDGTLVDSNEAHAHAWVDVGREIGQPVAYDEVRWLIGMGGDKVLPRLTGLDPESDEGKQVLARRGEIFRSAYLPRLEAFAEARALLERMRADGFGLVVATSASEEDMSALLEQAQLADLLPLQASSADADESKPAPDIVHAALQRAQADAASALMLGDTPYDVSAARKAGVPIVALTCGGWPRINLVGAREVYADPAELLRCYDRSAFGQTRR